MRITNKTEIKEYISSSQDLLFWLIEKDSRVLDAISGDSEIIVTLGKSVVWVADSDKSNRHVMREFYDLGPITSIRLSRKNLLDVSMLSEWVSGLIVISESDKNMNVSVESINYNEDINIFDVCINTLDWKNGVWKSVTSDFYNLSNILSGRKISYGGIYLDEYSEIISYGSLKNNEELVLENLGAKYPVHSVIVTPMREGTVKGAVFMKQNKNLEEYDLLIV